MIHRRELLIAAGLLIVIPRIAQAQSQNTIRRIGFLETLPMAANAANLDGFLAGMRKSNALEGRDFVIDYRSADGRINRFPELASELLRGKADLIVTRGTPATLAAKKATLSIPIVMTAVGDPIAVGLVISLARPGGNITGLTTLTPELEPKRLAILKELIPGLSRIAGLMYMANAGRVVAWERLESAARRLNIQSEVLDVRSPEDLSAAFNTAVRHGAGAVIIGFDGFTSANEGAIVELAAKYRMPAIYGSEAAGGLISYGLNYPDLYYRAAMYVQKIINGAKPADLPIEQPTKFELTVNMKTAKTLGIKVPQSILVQATKVIE